MMRRPGALLAPGSMDVIMFNLRRSLAVALTTAFFLPAAAVEPASVQFARLAAAPVPGSRVEVVVDLAASPGFSVHEQGYQAELRYRMGFNNIAEGWSWQPLADPAVEDYYRYKFLPLQSVVEERAGYPFEDKIGVPQTVSVRWRYDYFLAFANLYDFYAREADDEAGFVFHLPLPLPANLEVHAIARLVEPVVSESTTFWKATYGRPTDFTLKKRYLLGKLEEIRVVDGATGAVLAGAKALGPQR